ncbi:MAG TPA: hypothetical protein VLA13_02025 [Massilibacterium sp.]|nr:hypothetical protein [Massilibacterium sp.]
MSLPLHKRISRPLKRIFRTVGNTAGGDNKAGEAIHGILDLLPIPNQPIGKLIKAIFAGNWNEAKIEVGKLLTVRNAIAVLLTFLILTGVLTLEQVKDAFELFGKIIGYFNELGIN